MNTATTNNTAELGRVTERIATAITEFVDSRDTFHADELRRYVERVCGTTAPGSADRILRSLRQRQVINYVLLSRSDSLYQVLPLVEQPADTDPVEMAEPEQLALGLRGRA